MEKIIAAILKKNLKPEVWTWLEEKALQIRSENGSNTFNMTFAVMPRKTGKTPVQITEEEKESIAKLLPGFSVSGWSVDRLARVWILLQPNPSDKSGYVHKIEQLFLTAEMNELVALYSALPLMHHPEAWIMRCSEGIRSNIGSVLEAIMYENPYAEKWLEEDAWNQMIMKAFFTDKQVERIYGLDRRANQKLANILFDYAHERWQAFRTVNPQLWRLVGKFIDESRFADLQKLYREGTAIEKKAAILACSESPYEPARHFEQQARKELSVTDLNWSKLLQEIIQTSSN